MAGCILAAVHCFLGIARSTQPSIRRRRAPPILLWALRKCGKGAPGRHEGCGGEIGRVCVTIAFLLTLATVMTVPPFWNAPLEERANPARTPNPAKAPWYFLGLPELVSHSALVGGVLARTLLLLVLAVDKTNAHGQVDFWAAAGTVEGLRAGLLRPVPDFHFTDDAA